MDSLFFVDEPAATELYASRHTLSLHDVLPVSPQRQPPPRRMRLNHLVDKALARRDERVGEARFIFRCPFSDFLRRLATEDDLDRAFRAHHRDLGGWPGIVEIAAQMLRRHPVISATSEERRVGKECVRQGRYRGT